MKNICWITFLIVTILLSGISCEGSLDSILKGVGSSSSVLDNATIIDGLKEALSIATGNSVTSVSKTDGYFSNKAIKILMPEKIKKVADVLGKLGFQDQVDEFVLSMNRAAEKAAPEAKSIFLDAVKEMTFTDAKEILNGGDTAATDFFKSKTSKKLTNAFKPIISEAMDNVGVTSSYKKMITNFNAVPMMKADSMDLDEYVTDKSLEGLFHMVAQEEKKIRKNPAARVTDLLKKVFGNN